MGRFEPALEIGKGLHKLSHIFARRGIGRVMVRAQAHHEASKQALGSAHRLEREMSDIVAHPSRETAHFLAQERAEVDVFEYVLHALNASVEARAPICEEACPAPRLRLREYKEPYEERECDEDENE